MTDVIELLRAARDHTDDAPPLDLDVVRVRAVARRRRHSLAVTGTLGLIAVGAAAVGASLPARDGVVAGDGTGVPAFDRVQELPGDALPSSAPFDGLPSPADASSSRLVVNIVDVHAWVFRPQDDQICVLATPVVADRSPRGGGRAHSPRRGHASTALSAQGT